MNKRIKKNMLAASLLVASLCSSAFATPISHSATGIASPAETITFDEHVLPTSDPVTTQYADLGVTFSPNLYYSSQTGFPNIIGNTSTNFGNGPNIFQFSINFLMNQTDAAFAMVSNGTSWDFEALLGNVVVDAFSALVDTSDPNFFGFTGITFDEIRVTSSVNDFMIIDNLQLGKAPTSSVPEPAPVVLLGIGLAGLLLMKRRQSS